MLSVTEDTRFDGIHALSSLTAIFPLFTTTDLSVALSSLVTYGRTSMIPRWGVGLGVERADPGTHSGACKDRLQGLTAGELLTVLLLFHAPTNQTSTVSYCDAIDGIKSRSKPAESSCIFCSMGIGRALWLENSTMLFCQGRGMFSVLWPEEASATRCDLYDAPLMQ